MKAPRKLKVGVTLFLRGGPQSIWENGIFQNCFFLINLLQASPVVEAAFLVNGGDGKPEDAGDFLTLAPAPVIDMTTARETLDVIIELSAQLNPDWAREFRGRGGRVVGMRVANDYVIDIERMIFNLPNGLLASGTPYDVIWTLPAFEHSCRSYYETLMRAPVRAMQHLWSPVLIERSAELAGGEAFAYRPGRKRWRLAIIEPNICMVKTGHLPMLACDAAYRAQPDAFEVLRVYNTLTLKERADFVALARSLDMVRHGVASFEGRYPLYEVLTREAEAIVSHSWENEQNYVYYEALHGGYPLIHNSRYLGDCGYAYATFDPEAGGLALRQAFAQHDLALDDYRRRARAFLTTLDPVNPVNVEAYGRALTDLFTTP
ncbi:MAG: DUF2827 domain-containing protein [Alphaproteobacteria bacterium]|nr:DUF2827 domain-containing protein [Alphaproteobacteria bacterium]